MHLIWRTSVLWVEDLVEIEREQAGKWEVVDVHWAKWTRGAQKTWSCFRLCWLLLMLCFCRSDKLFLAAVMGYGHSPGEFLAKPIGKGA